jgi:hypothetical protein
VSKPIYYCRRCRLHRVCMNCWNKSQLKLTENDSGKRETRVRGRRAK